MKKIVAILCIIIGIGMFLYPKISNVIEKKYQTQIIKEYKEDVENLKDEEIEEEYEKTKKYNEKLSSNIKVQTEEYYNTLNLAKDNIMSYIEIPKISVNLPIYHGTEGQSMKKGVGHIEKTSLPIGGESTHTVLTGHTGLMRAEIFTRLNELQTNDEIYIYTLNKKLKYKVYQTKVVLPTETDDLCVQEGKDLLTLITCTPYGKNTHRLLVQCKRIENTEEKNTNNDIAYETSENKENYYEKGLKLRFRNIIIYYF